MVVVVVVVVVVVLVDPNMGPIKSMAAALKRPRLVSSCASAHFVVRRPSPNPKPYMYIYIYIYMKNMLSQDAVDALGQNAVDALKSQSACAFLMSLAF